MTTIAAALMVPVAAPAQDQRPRLVVVSADAPFAHAGSGVTLPATLLGLPRRKVEEIEAPQLDVAAAYPSDDAELTVYIYRATSGSVPVWFDRARWAIETMPRWGQPDLAGAPLAIAPPGGGTASGLLAGWTLTNNSYKGTGVALLPAGEWLVKLRYTSKSLDGAGVAGRLRDAVAALGWPRTAEQTAAAIPVETCAAPIAFKGSARTAPADGSNVILGALLSGITAPRSAASTTTSPATWCRDPAKVEMGGVYRPDADKSRYLLALSDAGRGVWVAPSPAGLFGGKRKPTWSVDLVLPGQTLAFPPQDRLPRPERVMELLKGAPVSSTSTTGPDRQVTLSPSSFGKR